MTLFNLVSETFSPMRYREGGSMTGRDFGSVFTLLELVMFSALVWIRDKI